MVPASSGQLVCLVGLWLDPSSLLHGSDLLIHVRIDVPAFGDRSGIDEGISISSSNNLAHREVGLELGQALEHALNLISILLLLGRQVEAEDDKLVTKTEGSIFIPVQFLAKILGDGREDLIGIMDLLEFGLAHHNARVAYFGLFHMEHRFVYLGEEFFCGLLQQKDIHFLGLHGAEGPPDLLVLVEEGLGEIFFHQSLILLWVFSRGLVRSLDAVDIHQDSVVAHQVEILACLPLLWGWRDLHNTDAFGVLDIPHGTKCLFIDQLPIDDPGVFPVDGGITVLLQVFVGLAGPPFVGFGVKDKDTFLTKDPEAVAEALFLLKEILREELEGGEQDTGVVQGGEDELLLAGDDTHFYI